MKATEKEDEVFLAYAVPKTEGSEVQFTIRNWKGRTFADIREWVYLKDEKCFMPTKKGLVMSVNRLRLMQKGIERLIKKAQDMGLDLDN